MAGTVSTTGQRWRGRFRPFGRPTMGLTGRMFALAVIAVLPAIGIQAYNEYDLRKSREDEIRHQTIQITRQFGEEMGELREGARQLLVALGELDEITSRDARACTELLTAQMHNFPNYNLIAVADPTGTVFCNSAPNGYASVENEPFFLSALRRPDLAVGLYRVDSQTGKKAIHFAQRFTDAHGQVGGVIFAGLDLDWLNEHLKERGLTPTQSILIADREGNIIARLPHPETLVGKNMRNGHAAIMDGNTAGWEEARGVDGIERIFGYIPPALPPYDLFLSAGQSKIEAFAAIDAVTRRGILLILIGLFLAMYAAWVGGRMFIKRPVEALLDVANQWRNGNLSARAAVKNKGLEIGRLSLAFNEMAESLARRQAAQQKAEDDLRDLNATLEERVEERTRELAAANRAKSQFLANMSHEIRTPMNGIIPTIDLLLQSELNPRQRRYAELVQRSAGSLLELLSQVLDLSKIEAGKFELDKRPFDLRDLMEDLTRAFSAPAQAKGVELACYVPANLPTALIGDPSRLRQILGNLLGNAVKFTERGEVTARARLVEADAATALIEFEVTDSGIGISPTDHARIFDAFAQADESTTRRYGGTGLGLNIARQLCEMMGGTIAVKSEVGVGSMFKFAIRFGQQIDAVRKIEPFARTSGARVLVVDDNPTNRELLEEQLCSEGHQISSVSNGQDALIEIRSAAERGQPFSFALIDMVMPEMNGIELARAIKADPKIADLPLIMLSSFDQEISGIDDLLAGRLTKSVRQVELMACIGSFRSADRNHAAPAPTPVAGPEPGVDRAGSEPLAGALVLLVEDSAVNLEVGIGILESFGCQVATEINGRLAVERVKRQRFDAIFMDCQMPEVDGFEASAQIRAFEVETGRERTPIIALTANAIQGDRERCFAAGMDHYLPKPCTQDRVRAVLMLSLCAGRKDEAQPSENLSFAASGPLPQTDDPIDDSVLDQLRRLQRRDGPNVLHRAIRMFLKGMPPVLRELQEGALAGNAAAVERAAHLLKSSSANVGAMRLTATCQELENLTRTGSLDRASGLVQAIAELFTAAEHALASRLEPAA